MKLLPPLPTPNVLLLLWDDTVESQQFPYPYLTYPPQPDSCRRCPSLPGAELRRQGLNRVGNMLVPNSNYCKFEDWIMPILDKMLEEQGTPCSASGGGDGGDGGNGGGTSWTPSKMIARFGAEINHPDSIAYWAAKNGIPIFCPALTDGSIGTWIYVWVQGRNDQVRNCAADLCQLWRR